MNPSESLSTLISIPSVSTHEEKIQKFIEKYTKTLDFDPFWVGPNLAVKIVGHNSSKAIIFNAHVDTVPVGNQKLWNSDPFTAKEIDGKIYGLGACDDKAAVADLLTLSEVFANEKPACDVWLTFVVKEELDGSGTAEFMKWFMKNQAKNYSEIAGVIGEPTNLEKIEIAHKGNIFLKVTTEGSSGHASRPIAPDKHAVEKMFKISDKLKTLASEWEKEYADKFLGSPTVGNLTSIAAGSEASPNKFPDTCTATFDIRTTPLLHDKAVNLIKAEIGQEASVGLVYPPIGCGYTDLNAKIVRIFQKATGIGVAAFSLGSSDLPFFSTYGIPAVIFGPGDPALGHQTDEYCEISKLTECAQVYAKIIEKFARA